MTYTILVTVGTNAHSTATDLEDKVNAAIHLGWRPLGGVSMSEDDENYKFAQSMVKGEEI